MTLRQRFALLFLLSGAGLAIYMVTVTGQRTEDATQAARICGIPSIPAAFYTALGIPQPTAPDGGGTGDCLPPAQAEDLFRKARIAASILPAWRAAGLSAAQCAGGLVAIEFGDGVDGGWSAQHEEVIRVCGPAPSAASTANIEKLRRLPGTSVRILETYAPFANSSYPVLTRWMRPFPAAVMAAMPCACANTQDAGTCSLTLPDGGTTPAPFGITLTQGSWTGTGCVKKSCIEAQEVVDVVGLGYSMPADCR